MFIIKQALNKLTKKKLDKKLRYFLQFQFKGAQLSFKYLRWFKKQKNSGFDQNFRNSYLVSPIFSIQMGILLSTAWFINLIMGQL